MRRFDSIPCHGLRSRGFTTTLRHTTLGNDSSGRVISPTQRPLPDNTQHSQQTNIHASGGIRTHNPSKRVAPGPRLRPRGHWERHLIETFRDYPHVFNRNAGIIPEMDREHLLLNALNPELNPICYLLALLGAHHFLHVSRVRVK
jgi:hypothetical protein